MSTELTSKDIKKCRKKHRCGWCGEWIEAGDPAHYRSGIYEGDFFTEYMHPGCWNALLHSDLYDKEFEPMMQYRGEVIK